MTAPRKRPSRRRYSPWTLLAPVALVVLVMLIANAIGSSGILGDKGSSKKASSASSSTDTDTDNSGNDNCTPPVGRVVVTVKSADTLSLIAEKYCTDEDTLRELNPRITDPQRLQLGQRILVQKAAVNAVKKSTSAAKDEGAESTSPDAFTTESTGNDE